MPLSQRHLGRLLGALLTLGTSIFAGCSIPPPLVERIKQSGELVVVTRNSPTTYYEGPEGPAGFEYELVTLFAESLGVKPRFIVKARFDEILPAVTRGEAHLAAAGITVTPHRETRVRFGPGYQKIRQQVVYRRGTLRPRKPADLAGRRIEVIAGSSHEDRLRLLRRELPGLEYLAHAEMESEELLQRVANGEVELAIGDSNEVAVNRRFYPQLAVAFDLTGEQRLAWAFAHAEDSSLFRAMLAFFAQIREDGTLDQLIERHYGHIGQLNFVDTRTFQRHTEQRLPPFRELFEQAAVETGIDWQLLAAISYQESHWNPKAVSPTGVRGLMMLTQAAAREIGVENRLDPQQSILGGARYLRKIEERIPDRIAEPDRMWLALAGYNVGFGHLEDARILTERQGGDPDQWAEVKRRLPLLSKKKYYQTLKRGYARGQEPVDYVDNIRGYYEILKWLNGTTAANTVEAAGHPALTIEPTVP